MCPNDALVEDIFLMVQWRKPCIIMAKKDKKKGGAVRLKKKNVAQMLVDLFNANPEKEYDVKEIFASLDRW